MSVITIGDTAKVLVTPLQNIAHTISCFAQFGPALDTAAFSLSTYEKPVFSSTSGNITVTAGTTDTLLLKLIESLPATTKVKLLDSSNFTPGTITILPSESTTVKFVFKPVESKTYQFSFLITKDSLSDTITFQKFVTGVQVPVWKISTATIIATEGKTVSHSFAPYLTDSSRTDMVYRASKGTITGKTVSTLVPWGSAQKDSITISADSNGIVSQFKLLLNIVSGDSALPKITLLSPASNPFTTNDTKVTCKFILSDIGAGIGKVAFTKNGSAITDTSRTDSLYQCNIDSLKHGVPVIVKLVAIDGSLRKNRDSLSVTITRDSTIEDKTPPTFSIVADTRVNGRVTVDTGTFKVSIEDGSGIDNGVIVKLNGTVLTGVTKTSSVYSIPYKITAFGLNAIIIKATDNSPAKNSDSLTINFDYNTTPTQLALVSPAHNAQEIDSFPTFKWSGGSDADGDSVFFKVLYGTSATALTSQSSEYANVSEIKLSTKLATNAGYFWKLIGYSKGTYKDTVNLGPYGFKTVNPDRTTPIITLTTPSSYVSGMRVTAATGSIAFSATDANGIDSVYYTVNTTGSKTMLTGINGAYTYSYTLPRRGLDTITITAVDLSEQHNKSTMQVIVNYNTPLPYTLTMGTPANNALEIAVLVPFSWTAVSDGDGDSVYYVYYVYYVVEYSTSQELVNSTFTAEVSIANLTINSGDALTSNTKYNYRIIAYTKTPYRDTVKSGIRSFYTTNLAPTATLLTPSTGTTRINPSTGVLDFNGSDPEKGTLTYSVAISTTASNVMSSTIKRSNLTSPTCNLSSFNTPLNYATQYYWQVIVTDNGVVPKSDTSEIFSFYTINRAPVWATIPSKDSTYYRCSIDLQTFCSDPDGNTLTYSVVAPSSATINGNVLTCASDSQLITIRAVDNFIAQRCTSVTTFRRWFVNPGLMKFIPMAGDTFTMGTNYAEDTNDERPAHKVQFSKSIFVDSTEVTQADYVSLMQVNPSNFQPSNNADFPVENLTWYDAVLYCNARSKHYGLDTVYTYTTIIGSYGNGCSELGNIYIDYLKAGFRLPSEAEWEYFARAKKTSYSPIMDYSWCSDNSEDRTHSVAQKKANNYKLYDILGNVQEYCNDWYQDHYDSTSAIHFDPIGPLSGMTKVLRGSKYSGDYNEEHMVTYRWNSNGSSAAPANRYMNKGFRIVRNVP